MEEELKVAEKPKSYKKYLLVFGLIFCLGLGSAALVTYYGTFTTQINVSTPIVMDTNLPTTLNLIAGDPYQTYWFSIENKLDENVPIGLEITLQEWDGAVWNNVVDDEGFYIAFIEADCLEDGLCDTTNYEANLIANTLSQWWAINDKNASNSDPVIMDITNNPNIIEVPLVNGVLAASGIPLAPGSTFVTGKYYGALYIETAPGLTPSNYRVTINMLPA